MTKVSNPTRLIAQNPPLWAVLILAGIVVVGKSLGVLAYFQSSYLFADDAIFLGAAILDKPMPSPHTQSLYYSLVNFLAGSLGLSLTKLLLLFMPVVTGLCMFKILRAFTSNVLLAGLLSAFLVLYPIAPAQGFFLTGAHPTAGVAIFMATACMYLAFLEKQHTGPAWHRILIFVGCGIGFYILSRTSPTFILVPVLFLPIGVAAFWHDRTRTAPPHLLYLALPVGMLALIYLEMSNYHYSSLEGWTEVSLSQSLLNLSSALSDIFQSPFKRHPNMLIWSAFSAGVLAFAVIGPIFSLFLNRKAVSILPERKFGPFLLFLLAATVLVFGPSSITTNFLERYVLAPFQIGGLLLGILILRLFATDALKSYLSRRVGGLALISLLAASITNSALIANEQLSPLLRTHGKIMATLSQRDWNNQDQILIVLPNTEPETTGGFNHWSTWYLRTVTGTPGLIGLVGREKYNQELQTNGLFIDTYADHGENFWTVKNGISTRSRMVGLTSDRATYAYTFQEGTLALTPLVLEAGPDRFILQPGQRFADRKKTASINKCDSTNQTAGLTVNLLPHPDTLATTSGSATNLLPSPFIGTGDNADYVNVEPDPSGRTSVHFDLNGTAGSALQAYSDTYPPMPVLAPGLAVYLQDETYIFQEIGNTKKLYTAPVQDGQATRVDIFDCGSGPSTNALYIDGVFRGLLTKDVLYGRWRIGAGFNNRYWTGEITKFQSYQASR